MRLVGGICIGAGAVVGALFIIGDRLAKAILEEVGP